MEIVGDEHELMQWDEPSWKDQGVGAPSPIPSRAFLQPLGYPSRAEVREALAGLPIIDGQGRDRSPGMRGKVVAFYFSAHW